MSDGTKIEWTDATVNFWWGCTKVGPGCDNCYAEAWDHRFGGEHWGHGAPRRKIKSAKALLQRLDNQYADWAAAHECRAGNARAFGLPDPGTCSRQRVFIQSMSDLFDNEVPLDWFREAWETIEACDRLYIQILTKRVSMVEKRLAAIGATSWPAHAGLMITVVNQAEADRDVPRLLDLKARLGIPWVGLSCEPLLGPVDLTTLCTGHYFIDALQGIQYHDDPDGVPHYRSLPPSQFPRLGDRAARIDWVVAGGESGPGARPAHPDWFRALRDQCDAAGVPFFFKQHGEWVSVSMSEGPGEHYQFPNGATVRRLGKKAAGDLLDGLRHHAWPEARERRPVR